MSSPTVFAVTMVKDEADIIEGCIRHMLEQVDAVIVADNGSTDGTREALETLPVNVLDDNEPAYYQSEKMSGLAAFAASQGADWVVPFDADELWEGADGSPVKEALAECGATIVGGPIINYVATAEDDPALPPIERIHYRLRDVLSLPKVACRPFLPVLVGQGNHTAHYPEVTVRQDVLTVRHFPYRSAEQFLSKVRNGAAAYRATNLPRSVGEHWRQYGELLEEGGPEAVEAWFHQHFFYEHPADEPSLMREPVG
jgi:Glycosyl transferase family 2